MTYYPIRLILVLLWVVVVAAVAAAQSIDDDMIMDAPFSVRGHAGASFIGELDLNQALLLEADFNRRSLGYKTRYISYAALAKASVPCGRRGSSYYDCNAHKRANPYTRGCTAITHCARRYVD